MPRPSTRLLRATAIPFALACFPTPAEAVAAVEEIVVTGTRTERLQREAPVRTDVIGDVILSMAAPRSLADALEFLPGARSESNCQNCNTTEIQLLGLPGAYNQILFDGLPMMSGLAAVYGVEQVPVVLVERIEVVKGGASALYGPGAVAGVVNVIPRRPKGQQARLSLSHERPDGKPIWAGAGLLSNQWADSGLSGTLFGQYDRSRPVDLNGDGYTELTKRRLATGGIRLEAKPAEGVTVTFDYQFTDEDRRGGNRLDQPEYLANIAEAVATKIHRGALTWTQEIGKETTIVATYAYAGVKRDTFYGGLGDVATDPSAPGYDAAALAAAAAVSRNQYGTTDNPLHFGEARLQTGIGAHELAFGAQYRHESVDDRNLDVDGRLVGQLTDDSFDNLGLYAQDEWTLREGLRLVLGGRVDWSSELDDPVISPRVGLWYSPVPAWVFRANISTGFRAPEVFSEDLHVDVLGAEPVRIRNVDGLQEETSRSFALGFDYRPEWKTGR